MPLDHVVLDPDPDPGQGGHRVLGVVVGQRPLAGAVAPEHGRAGSPWASTSGGSSGASASSTSRVRLAGIAGMPAWLGQGSRPGRRAPDDDVGVDAVVLGDDPGDATRRHLHLVRPDAGADVDLPLLEAGHQGVGQGGQAALDPPSPEAPLDVVLDGDERRGGRGLMAVEADGVEHDGAQPARRRGPCARAGPDDRRTERALADRPIEVVPVVEDALEDRAAQDVPRLGQGVDPRRPGVVAECVDDRVVLVAAVAEREVEHRPVGEDVPAAFGLDEVDDPLDRTAGLAEQVAQHAGQRHGVGAQLPGASVDGVAAQSSAQLVGRLQQGDVVPQLGQARRRRHPGEAATDHHDPRHGRRLLG